MSRTSALVVLVSLTVALVASPCDSLAWQDFDPTEALDARTTDQLRDQLKQLVESRADQMTDDELRRAIGFVEQGAPQLPEAANEILDSFNTQANEVRTQAARKIIALKKETLKDLVELQNHYVKSGQLGEALAVADLIRTMAMPPVVPQANPGNLTNFRGQTGKVLYFRVTGATTGSVWGAGVYTDDSSLAAAAVHAGAVQNGQTAIVKVTILPGQANYQAGTRNGVTTFSYGTYPGSYRVEKLPQLAAEIPQEANQ